MLLPETEVAAVLGLGLALELVVVLEVMVFAVAGTGSGSGGGGGRILGLGLLETGGVGWSIVIEGGTALLELGPGILWVGVAGIILAGALLCGETGNVGIGIDEEDSAVGSDDGGSDGGWAMGTP